MTPGDRPKFAATLAGLTAIKPGKGLTPEAMDLWWNAMCNWSIEDFVEAASHLARTVEFMPSPYHFEQLRKSVAAEAGADAWAAVVHANRTGDRSQVSLQAERVVRAMGGWNALATMLTTDLPFREKRFRELWAEVGQIADAREALPALAAPDGTGAPRLASVAQLLPNLTRSTS